MTPDDQQNRRTDMKSNSGNTKDFLDFTYDIHSSSYNNVNYLPVNFPNILEVLYEMNPTINDQEKTEQNVKKALNFVLKQLITISCKLHKEENLIATIVSKKKLFIIFTCNANIAFLFSIAILKYLNKEY
ncbi:13366_t:CDS:2 [Funneliformis geosporum]|nr:13366_t:CDS:2 [Funneliformis geosporum]